MADDLGNVSLLPMTALAGATPNEQESGSAGPRRANPAKLMKKPQARVPATDLEFEPAKHELDSIA
jgi:hypothetical protein